MSIPYIRDDELETLYLVRLESFVEVDERQRSPELRALLPESPAALWLRIMQTACPRWRKERIRRIARRMYRASTWYLKPWQTAIDVARYCVIAALNPKD